MHVFFLTVKVTTTINGVETVSYLLPDGIRQIVSGSYNIAVIVLFIYAIIKYNQLKNKYKKQLNNY